MTIAPSAMLDLNYFKTISAELNRTLKFTFGSNISRMINRQHDLQYQANDELVILKASLDDFFAKFNRRLLEATYFEVFDNPLDDFRQSHQNSSNRLGFSNRLNVYREMRTKFMNSMPYHDLPFNIKTDLDSALVNLEAQEFFDDLEKPSCKTRRLFTIKGSCLFFKVDSQFFYKFLANFVKSLPMTQLISVK